ncbi:MAG: response regulator [Pseudomonadales bacterium]|nr:response regulator [Pseudomonadales bacterium]
MTQADKLLVVDDETSFLELVEDACAHIYNLTLSNNSTNCIELIDNACFDLILLDLNIDQRNGFELCEYIRTTQPEADVIFISGRSRQEDIVKGYRLGAIDYLTKPIRPSELIEKIAALLALREEIRHLKKDTNEARQVAFSAMADTNQLGRILEFIENSVYCSQISDLASALLETCQSLHLQATIYIKTPAEKIQQTTNGIIAPIEILLIEQLRHQGRIIDFNQRSLYNDKNITLLIKNMPIDNALEYGRLKDRLTTLVCGANSRVNAIINEQLLDRSRDAITSTLISIETQIDRQSQLSTNLMKEFMTDMEAALLVLGLSPDQEDYVLSLVDTHLTNVVQVVTGATETQLKLRSSLQSLQR